jgi:hypothetical protein
MPQPSEMVNVRYMVDDVDARRVLHKVPRLRSSDELRARVRRRRPRQPAAAAQRTDQLRGATDARWRQAGTRRLESHPPDRRRHRCRSGPTPQRRCTVPQRHPRRTRRQADPAPRPLGQRRRTLPTRRLQPDTTRPHALIGGGRVPTGARLVFIGAERHRRFRQLADRWVTTREPSERKQDEYRQVRRHCSLEPTN